MKKVRIGIDLGTSTCCLARVENEKPEVIETNDGNVTPSFVYFDPINKKKLVAVGKTKMNEVKNIKNCVYDVKRFIGRRWNENVVQNIYKNYPFTVLDNKGEVAFEITQNRNPTKLSPETVSSEILKYFKECVLSLEDDDEEDDENNVRVEAVITIPAYFNNSQREATLKAAELANIEVLYLMKEPTAAAYYYFNHKKEIMQGLAIVYDLGGGTFDISVINVDSDKISVKCVDGDGFLGGVNFDENITKHFIEQLTKQNIKIDSQQHRRIKITAKLIKEDLSKKKETEKTIDLFFTDGRELKLSMTRDEFEQINMPLFTKSLEIVKNCLSTNKIDNKNVKYVILVGGSTRIPKVRDLIGNFFGSNKIITDIDPDQSIALGAALRAYTYVDKLETLLIPKGNYDLLQTENEENPLIPLERYNFLKIEEIVPMSIGSDSMFEYLSVDIEANTNIPISKPFTWTTSSNNQESIAAKIYEGQWKYAPANHYLGKIVIDNLPRGEAGKVKINVNYNIDENGILKITAELNDTNRAQLEVTINKNDGVPTVEWNAEKDAIFEEKTLFKKSFYTLYSKYVYRNNPNGGDANIRRLKQLTNRVQLFNFLKEIVNKHNGENSIHIQLLKELLKHEKFDVEAMKRFWNKVLRNN